MMGVSRLCGVAAAAAMLGGAGYSAAAPMPALAGGPYVCSGSPTAPGVLAGSFGSVEVVGLCAVNGGAAVVHGNLTVTRGAALVAAFGLNDVTGQGSSHLTVDGNLNIENGGAALLGCFPTSFPCIDDPNPSSPTLSSHVRIGGNLTSDDPLGVIVHDGSVAGNVTEEGGGGGVNCTPQGIFAVFQSPVYSDYEDSSIGGSLSITGLSSCWLGAARVHVHGSAWFINVQLADPDGVEILANDIDGNLTCTGNSMVWDSAEAGFGSLYPRILERNQVAGTRSGQCVLASPRKLGGKLGPGKF
jgi:hypothetical protein